MNDDTSYIKNSGTKVKDTGSQDAVPTGWFKVDTRMLNSGYNGFTVGAAAKDGNRWLSAVKRVAVVPRSYNWTPEKSATPTQCEAPAGVDYFYKKAQEADVKYGYLDYGTDKFMGIINVLDYLPKLYFDVNLNNSGLYDIWLDSSEGDFWRGKTGFKMNDDAALTPNSGTKFGGETCNIGIGIASAWHKADTRMLQSGYNSLEISPYGKDSYNRYGSVVKRVAIVPKSYNWDPTKSEIPEQYETDPATEYGFSYAKDYAVKTGNWAQSPVRNTTMVCMWTQEENNTLIYEVNLANDGNYDFWIENVSNDWAGKLTYSIDGGEYTAASGNFVGEAVESYYYNIKTQWQKAKTVNLTAGVHTVTFKLNRYNDDNGYIGVMNAFALSPKSWKWSPVDSPVPVEPVKPEAKEYAWLEAENFDVPDGSRFVSETNDAASGKTYMKVDHTGTDAETNDITYTFEESKKSTLDIDNLSTQQGVS